MAAWAIILVTALGIIAAVAAIESYTENHDDDN